MDWHPHVRAVMPHVVRIETPKGYGTGFLRHRQDGKFGIATARHVVAHAGKWEQNIKIYHESSATPITLRKGQRSIVVHRNVDAAMIVGDETDALAQWPEAPIELADGQHHLRQGVAVGWLGYPHLVEDGTQCCFFSGSVSAFREHRYFIDGVAIQGVSGGPAFCAVQDDGDDEERLVVIGSITEYHPNRAGGDTLPGLLVAEDVSGFPLLQNAALEVPDPPTQREPPA